MGRVPPLPESLATRRRRLAEEREARQAEAHRRARADGTNALGHTPEQQRAMGLGVLQSAHVLAQADAQHWAQGYGARNPRHYCMAAGGGGIEGHYALALLGYLEPRPYTYAETLALLSDAIVRAGGAPPAPLKPPRGKPGPKVSSGKPSEAEVERRRALLAAALKQP